MNDTETLREFSVNLQRGNPSVGKNAVVNKEEICYNKENIMESATFSERERMD